jgi:hypothetical protein
VSAAQPPRTRLYQGLAAIAKFFYEYPGFLLLLPLAVFFPLLDSRGLYEYGDANFPLNPFWLDYMLPWSGAASAGADNTFIGVPRLIYHVVINLLIGTFHNLQVAQWLWYSAMSALGLMGAFALARRLGAGIYSVPLAIFYAFNLWSYDRIAQGPIYLSYQAMALVVYLFLRYLGRPGVANALYFACSLLLVIPALQISYLAAVICLAFAVREIVLRGWRVLLELGGLAVAVVAVNAFYIFSMLADMWLNNGGNIALVNQRFNMGVFAHYSTNVSIFNTLRLQSFYYTSIARQPFLVALGVTLLPLLLLGLLLLARRPVARSMFYWGLGLALLGIWLVDGLTIAPAFYTWFHFAVPGVRSFVEPDYFTPLYLFGAFVMLAGALRLGARAYGGLWQVAIWVTALGGILPFLPINGDASGLPRTGQPRQYREFSQAHVQGNTLWLPPDRGVQYRWSPYTINGFTSLNSPSDAIGPTMAEWVAPGTARVQSRLSDAFLNVQPKTAQALAPLLGVGTIAIAADSLSPDFQWPDPEIVASLETLRALRDAGFVSPRNDYRDLDVHLITATTRPPLPEIGIFNRPVDVGGFDNFMWRAVLSTTQQQRYTPAAADVARGARFGMEPLRSLPAPPVMQATIPIGAFDNCNGKSRVRLTIPANFVIQTKLEPRCFSFTLPNIGRVVALQAILDAQPADVAQMQLGFYRRGHDVEWVDPALAAQEIPPATRAARLYVRIPPYSTAVVRNVALRWASRGKIAPIAPPPTCAASDVAWSEQNPMAYTVEGTIRGQCAVIFRQSFAPVWSLWVGGGSAKVLGHLQVDGFANGWIVEGAGPVTFHIINLALFAYAGGMALTIASLVLALGLAVRSGLSRSARRARHPQPTA